MRKYDVVVIGLGGLGSAICYHLAKRGQRVCGVEQYHAVHKRGASHGETRGVWQAYFMGPGYVPLLRRAYELWDELGAECGRKLFHRTGGICVGPADGRLVPAAQASADACGLEYERLTAPEIAQRFPSLHPADNEVAIYDPSSGYVRPHEVVDTHIRLAREAGAELHFEVPVVKCEESGKGVEVQTSDGSLFADKVVVAAGAWLPRVLPALPLKVEVLRKVMIWFDAAGDPKSLLPGNHPYWIWEADGVVGYGHPAVDGLSGGIKAGIHSDGDPTDPDELNQLVATEEVELVRNFLKQRIPAQAGRYLRSDVCMYDNTPDFGFVIGPTPQSDRIFVAGGSSGHAFKFVPAIGEMVMQMVCDGGSAYDATLFDPSRF